MGSIDTRRQSESLTPRRFIMTDLTVIAQLLRAIAWLLFALFLLALAASTGGSILSLVFLVIACAAALQGMVFVWSTPKNS
jgi:hypothetical protein